MSASIVSQISPDLDLCNISIVIRKNAIIVPQIWIWPMSKHKGSTIKRSKTATVKSGKLGGAVVALKGEHGQLVGWREVLTRTWCLKLGEGRWGTRRACCCVWCCWRPDADASGGRSWKVWWACRNWPGQTLQRMKKEMDRKLSITHPRAQKYHEVPQSSAFNGKLWQQDVKTKCAQGTEEGDWKLNKHVFRRQILTFCQNLKIRPSNI